MRYSARIVLALSIPEDSGYAFYIENSFLPEPNVEL